ncbi:Afadin and alpha-actinin-binding-domain-containing protein [Triangularia setosa]|uniref:Afadin and alpha-actinin-binding-domain-containing protein n=1 Tax=Triangularia setosa TaxID=2587417 RepID=A0AAN7A8K6_9PEZI|nr:Afadin and alpha-actinin-binding-domain-containing protein [Podospora setosa]
MIVSENLRTASLYINNQLLSRGLLRDGQNIDFTNPGESEEEMGETMSRIMSVVNDLILRRDRDAEHRESLSATLRTLRAESLRQANDIQRLQEKNAEAQRKAGLSEAAETALRMQIKTAEATIHRLKEEAARTKLLAAQTRSACATEVRKRDRQIEGLKKAVTEAARARGASKSPGVTTITVVGDIRSDVAVDQQGNPLPPTPTTTASSSDGYDLRQETNSFLAELAKGLSEENGGLLTLIRRTTEQLKDMSGWDAGMMGNDGFALSLPSGYEDMAAEIEAVLEHLRTILTNPSFVPIEEVVVREEEINRLRDGWEKMETRWKEAVHLIDGWRRRMQASGRPVNVEELKMGLRLSPVKVQNVEETAQGGLGLRLEAVQEGREDYHHDYVDFAQDEGPLELVPEGGMDDQDESDTSSVFDDQHVDMDELDVEEPNVEILQQSVVMHSPPVAPAPQLSPLREHFSAGNKGGRDGPNLRRRPKFAEENVRSRPVSEDSPLPPPHADRPPQSPSKKPLLSVRTVPPEDTGAAAQPSSAAVSTPDTSISMDSVSVPKSAVEPKSAVTKTSAPAPPPHATKPIKKPSPAPRPVRETRKPPSRHQDREEKKISTTSATTTRQQQQETEARQKKVTSRPPVTRPTRPPITRGRSETRKGDGDTSKPSKPAPRNNSATSTTSTRSAPVTSSSKTSIPPNPEPTPGRSPRRVNSRLPLPRNSGSSGSNASACATATATNSAPVLQPPQSPTQAQQSPLSMATIQAKLAASERDADAARVRAKLKAARKGINLPAPGSGLGTAENSMPNTPTETMSTKSMRSEHSDYIQYQPEQYDDGEDELGMSAVQPHQIIHPEKPRKRERNLGDVVTTRKTSGRVASRRRSTLNPWELETLIKGGGAE